MHEFYQINSLFIEMNRPRQSWMIAGALLCSEKPPQYKYCRAFLPVHCFWCSFFIFLHYFQCKVLYLQKSKSVWNSYTIPSASNCP